jgi:soluble lytic murein transglycosylase-like protein
MKMSRRLAIAVLGAAVLAGVLPAQAQIASYVDEHGKLVFINGDSPEASNRSTMNHQAARTVPASGLSESAALPPERLERIVHEAATRHQLDPALVKAVISTESGWNPQAVSRKGAVGLMQLIPETAQRYGGGNLFDPAQNVEAGTTYLKSLLDRYDGDLTKTLAAYNAGEGAVDRFGGIPAIRETRRYVEKVTSAYFRPGSGHDQTQWSPVRAPMRKEVAADGRVVFTNE